MGGRDEIRWGILGAGRMARTFALDIAMTPGNRVETIAARDPARAALLSQSVGATRSSDSYQTLVEDPSVDVVYVATVHTAHHEHALLALDAGKSVVIEKPLAMTAAKAGEIASHAAAAQVFCMEGMWMRMHPLILRAREVVSAGTIGELLSVHAQLSVAHPYAPDDRLYDPAVGGGVTLDLGVYPAHFAHLFLGSPTGISASLTFASNGADDGVAMRWAYPRGKFAQLQSSFRGPSALGGIVSGTDGSIHIGPRLNRPRKLTVYTEHSVAVAETIDSPGGGFGFEITEVARCIRDGLLESPLAPLRDSIEVLAALDQVRQARLVSRCY